jgi:hypothetical protein
MVPLLLLAACCAIVPVGIALAALLGRGRKDKETTPPDHNVVRPARFWHRLLSGW